MSNDTNTVTNLIDLSADDEVFSAANPSSSSNPALIPLTLVEHSSGPTSIENNPFDCIQDQANRPDDPFELLSQEASHQLHRTDSPAAATQAEVRTENLLWISDDNIKVEECNSPAVPAPVLEFSKLQVPSSRFSEPISSVSSIESGNFSPCDDSAFTSRNESSKTVNKAFITDNTISSLSEDSRTPSLMNKAFVGSCSSFDVSQSSGANSTPAENSDNSSKGRSQKAVDARKRLLKLSLSNSTTNSPHNRRQSEDENPSPQMSVFTEAENLADHFSSRCMLDSVKSFDDSCDDLMSIKPNWVDSETDIDSDLEMMKIPILQEIPSPTASRSPPLPVDEAAASAEKPNVPLICKSSPDIEALKEKVQQHKAESNNNHEVSTLIENLKHVIKNCANDTKKAEANNLLESLSNLLNDKNVGVAEEKMDTLTPPPQPIVRQGTFDIDLKENEENEEHEKQDPPEDHCSDPNISNGTHSVHSADEAPQEVSNIVEQIGRLLGNQNVNVVQANINPTSGSGPANPTYIVVMNTPIQSKQRPSIESVDFTNDGSPDFTQSQIRRRSQSLSLHDKGRQFTAPPAPSPVRPDFRTPSRNPMVRRNSFSSATPTTPSIHTVNRRSVYGAGVGDTVTKPNNQMPRRSMALETHHEKQRSNHQSQPSMRMAGGIGFNAKKLKFKQSTESIVKACGPLKATIPVKKVAPLIVTTNLDSPPIEDMKSVTSTPNIQLATADGYPNACSTPMVDASPIKRTGIVKSRYSFVATTPTSKPSHLTVTPGHSRRRTMSEMKSPKKVADKPNSVGISKPAVKTVKLPQNFSKTLNKMAPSTSRGTLRLTKPSASASAAETNKENKLPRTGR